MKILQIGKYYPPDFGGIETVTQQLAEGLNRADIHCDVLCASSTRQTKVDVCDGYRIVRVGSYGNKFSVPLSPSLIQWLWNVRNSYDIIHLHLPNPLAELAVYVVRPKAKLILHWHADVDTKKFGILAKFHAPLTRWIIKRASRVIGATKAHIKYSDHKDIMSGKDVIIPYPFSMPDLSVLSSGVGFDLKGFGGRFIVLSVGRLIYYKGFKYLIDAAKYLPSKCLILIAGAGPMEEELQAQINSNKLSDRVILTGRLKESELMTLFSACDVFCFPSTDRGEMFGMVQLEAMAFKKPVIGTRIPDSGVCEVNLNDITGITVPIKNSNAIANAIIELMNDPVGSDAMGQEGYLRVNEIYAASVVIPQFIDLFEECLND